MPNSKIVEKYTQSFCKESARKERSYPLVTACFPFYFFIFKAIEAFFRQLHKNEKEDGLTIENDTIVNKTKRHRCIYYNCNY